MRSWIALMIAKRRWVVIAAGLITLVFIAQLRSLSVIIDADDALPQTHPYIVVNNEVEKIFGNKFTAVVGITAKEGDVFQPAILGKVKRITDGLMMAPGVVKSNVTSFSARKAKNISGNAEGMSVTPLMEKIPADADGMKRLVAAVEANSVYSNLLVSKDHRTAQVVAEFRKVPGGFKPIENAIEAVVAPERDASVDIAVGGLPTFLATLEAFSERMAFLFPLAVLIIGLIHYEAFRTVQALFLPLVTALIAVVWAVGILAVIGQPMDVFNASTPILILAIAAGHAVQILKRYYEEFAKLKEGGSRLAPTEMNREAVLQSLTKVGPVMIVACMVASLGFFSLMIFEIKSIRTFGIFTGSGVLSALILELTFIPALRAMLPAPSEREYRRERKESFWDRLTSLFHRLATQRRALIYSTAVLVITALSLGGYWLKIDNSQKGYFGKSVQARIDDDKLNERMAGTNTLYVLVDAHKQDAIKDPAVLLGMEKMQRFFEAEPNVGKTVSLVDFIKRMNQSMNEDKKDFDRIPESHDLIAQYLLLYSNSGEPGDFDSYVDNDYQRATVQAFLKTDSSLYVDDLAKRARAFALTVFPAGVTASIGGGTTGGVALNEVMIHEKVLNILQIMGAVFLISSLVFRSPLAGLLILVPLVAAVFVNFGVMGLLGIPLQIATALVSAMAVGIGADYGIYLSYRLREELRATENEDMAIEKAFKSAGKATLFVSSAVAGGFGVLMLSSGFYIHIWMGFLIALAMLVSALAALTIFPALILTIRPRFIFGDRRLKMSKNTVAVASFAFIALLPSFLLPRDARADAPTATEIAARSFAASKVGDSTSDSVFRLVAANGQERVRDTYGETKLEPGTTDNRRVVTFNSPSDVKGTKTLLVEHSGKDDDIWIYLPALKKVRRLVSSNKKDAFVGTDFSYGDVIGHKTEDWTHATLKEDKVDGRPCWVIEATPKTPSVGENSGYSKRVSCVDKESYVALTSDAYDLEGKLVKKITAKKLEKIDAKNNKWQPMVLAAENVQTNHKTIIEFRNFKANVGVKDETFTARYLEKQ